MIETDKLDKTKIYWIIENDGAREFYINGEKYYLEFNGSPFVDQIIPLLETFMDGDGEDQYETIICPECGEIAWNQGVEENKHEKYCWVTNHGKTCGEPITCRHAGIHYDSKLIMMITEEDKENDKCRKESNWANQHYVKIEVYEND